MPRNPQRYLEGLLRDDPHFRQFWRRRSTQEQQRYSEIWQRCDLLAKRNLETLRSSQEVAFLETRRWLSLVQEAAFSYSRIPVDWSLVATDRSLQRRIYGKGRLVLTRFLDDLGLASTTRLYGGIKPLLSIRRKAYDEKRGNAVQRNVLDMWDLVRFRICAEDIYSLLKIGVGIWDRSFDNVIRCRNYYFRPRGGNSQDSYRALHFELLDGKGGMFEVQVMTVFRESVSLLDHAPRFKRTMNFLDGKHESWLIRISLAANILEFEGEDPSPFASLLGRK